tara:strand:- start:327 stop:1064 length:738 start_codon:yes stop_codon:yes gene_type:complete
MKDIHGITIVGVGPGDPSLLTLAAVNAIQKSDVIAFPVAIKGAESMAAEIASEWITREKKRLPLLFPMVSDVQLRKDCWNKAIRLLIHEFEEGKKISFLCQGDVSLFGTGSYILLGLLKYHPKCPVNVIPGITSVCAAAAYAKTPLALQKEQLLILPAPDNSENLVNLLQESSLIERTLVLLKIGNRWCWLRPLLEKLGLLDSSLFIQRVGFPDQEIVAAKDLDSSSKPYFSLLLIRKNWPEILP